MHRHKFDSKTVTGMHLVNFLPFRYGLYVGIIFIIMYGDKSQNAYLEKSALETAFIHGGTNCDILPDDDPNFKACDPEAVPDAWINFMKVKLI